MCNSHGRNQKRIQERDHLGDVAAIVIILKLILKKKWDVSVWDEFICHRTGTLRAENIE
jgi:hypothetical protein